MTSDGTSANLPDAGWYADPQQAGFLRWWDGFNWSDHRKERMQQGVGAGPSNPYTSQATPTQPDASVYVPMARYAPTPTITRPLTKREMRVAKDREVRHNNSMAYTGLALSLIGFLFNPLAIPSVLGIVFSSIGLAKANDLESSGYRVIGRGTAVTGLIVGLAGVGLFLFRLSQVLG